MKEFVLILFAHVGPMAEGNSNALAAVPGFTTHASCEAAGEKAKTMARNTVHQGHAPDDCTSPNRGLE